MSRPADTVAVAAPVEHRGFALRCPVCTCERFFTQDYALRSVEDEMLKQPWATCEARAYVCAQCSHILWFADSGA